MKVITTTGDGNCFFHSIATASHINLQVCVRDGNGVPQDPHCRMAAFTKKNSDECEDMDQDVLKLDMPSHVRCQCYKVRINAMSKLNTMPGGLKIIAMTNMLKKTLKILKHSGEIIKVYGAKYKTSPIVLQFTDVGEYVGHYDCILEGQEEEEEPLCRTELSSLLQALSPLPRIKNPKKRARKSESAAILTFSPYKAYLSDKANKVNKVNKTQTSKERKKSSGKQAKTTKPKKQWKQGLRKPGRPKKRPQPASDSDLSDEEWPCIYCLQPWAKSKPGEEWIRCCIHKKWAHLDCTENSPYFVCLNCESDSD